jgi:hypothetical protein
MIDSGVFLYNVLLLFQFLVDHDFIDHIFTNAILEGSHDPFPNAFFFHTQNTVLLVMIYIGNI